MNKSTLEALIVVADYNSKRAERLFKKHDNVDDMNEAKLWRTVRAWLKGLLGET